MITEIFFFPNGNIAAVDKDGKQVPGEQEPAWAVVLRDMKRRRVVNAKTIVHRPAHSFPAQLKDIKL